MPLSQALPRWSSVLPRAASAAVCAVAVGTLVGWWWDVDALRGVQTGFVPMNPTTALCFILASASLWLQVEAPVAPLRRLAARICAAAVALTALLVTSNYLLGFDIAVDRLYFADKLAVAQPVPNRMGPNTATAFLLLGTGLLTYDTETPRGRSLAEPLILGAALIALIAVIGYTYATRPLYGIGPFIPMALNTCVAFTALSVGALAARPRRGLVARLSSPRAGGVMARMLLPGATALLLVLGWLWLRASVSGVLEAEFGVALSVAVVIALLTVLVSRTAALLDRADEERERVAADLRAARDELARRVEQRTTERERAEAALRATADQLRVLVEASPLAICGHTVEGVVTSWNAAAERMFGYTAAEVIGRLQPLMPAGYEQELAQLRERVLSGTPVTDFETRRRHKDGRLLDVSISLALVSNGRGEPAGVVAIYTDITARKALEEQFRQAQKMEAVGRLAGGVAHDFNNVLTVIRSQTEFLLDSIAEDDPRRKDVLEIQSAADRATAFTRQLLAFSRRQIMQPKVVDLNSTITSMEAMLRRLIGEDVRLVTRLAPDLAPIWADPGQLQQVIMNLVVNARDAMPDGGTLLIETANVEFDEEYPRRHPSTQPGPHVMLAVTDTGCGMDAAVQARIFEPFFTTKDPGKGTGLGLSTVYGIVKQSGGHIWVYSEVGRGTTFKLYFPPHRGSVAPNRLVARAAGLPETEMPRGGTILLVEDDAKVRGAVRRALERFGYQVVEARHGQEALELATAPGAAIDLVLSDMVMPGLGGLELAKRLRAVAPTLRVLLMTGYTQESLTRAGEELPPDAIIEKPFTLAGMLERVRRAMGD